MNNTKRGIVMLDQIKPDGKVIFWRHLNEEEEEEAMKLVLYMLMETGEELNDVTRSIAKAAAMLLKACVIEKEDGELDHAFLCVGTFDSTAAQYDPSLEIPPVSDEMGRMQ